MTTPHYLTREEILNARDRKSREVPAPEWGGTLLVRGLSGSERDQFEIMTAVRRSDDAEDNLKHLRGLLASMTIVLPVDPDDESKGYVRVFSEDDVVALGEKSARPLDLVFEVAASLSGISDRDVEKLVKALPLDQTGSTGSATPKPSTALAQKPKRG